MAVYFLRHGETPDNVANIFSGQRQDPPLTQLGVEQAWSAGEDVKNYRIARIISSRLHRARLTTTVVSEVTGIDTIGVDDRITEYDMGALSGLPSRRITSRDLVAAEGAEDPVAFQDRVLEFLRAYKDRDDNTLMVSHAGVGRVIEASRQGIDPREFFSVPKYPNAQVVALDLSWLK